MRILLVNLYTQVQKYLETSFSSKDVEKKKITEIIRFQQYSQCTKTGGTNIACTYFIKRRGQKRNLPFDLSPSIYKYYMQTVVLSS